MIGEFVVDTVVTIGVLFAVVICLFAPQLLPPPLTWPFQLVTDDQHHAM